MQKEWSSFRITLLLYLVVLILPFSFYFVYSSFKTMQNDTRIVRQSSWLSGSMNNLAIDSANKNNQQTIKTIDQVLSEISLWTTKNSDSKLYIGTESISKDFSQVNACWNSYKNDLSLQQAVQCYNVTENMAVIIEKMVYLKQKKIINIFYISLALAMIFALLMIYLVRVYIHRQMKKHAIYDHETKLFNKKYFLTELHSTFSRAKRHESPLSLIFVSLNGFTDKTYDKKTKRNLMQELGEVFTFVTRDSDISCRYDENHFAILVPLSDREHALLLEDRLEKALEDHNFEVTPEMKFSFVTTEANADETEEAFISRTKSSL